MAMFKPKDFVEVAQLIGQFYEQAEQDVIAMIAKNAEKQLSQSQAEWLKTQQASIKQNQAQIMKILEAYQKEGAKVLNRLPVRMYLSGLASADTDLFGKDLIDETKFVDIETAIKHTDGFTITGNLGIVHAGAVNALASAYLGVLNNAIFQVVRNADDKYKKIITEATTTALLGSETQLQAVQKALDKFLANGVGGFRDSAGRVWSLGAYIEMATRTLIAQANNQGKVNRYTEHGRDLVIVSSHQRSCELCRPWQRKILSLSGKSQEYRSIDEARSAGLFHPNCGHTFTAYVPGLTEIDGYMSERQQEEDKRSYQAQQDMRSLERRLRQAKVELAKAVTPEAKAKAQAKIAKYSSALQNISDSTGIPRRRSAERINKSDLVKQAIKKSDPTKGPGKATGSTKKPNADPKPKKPTEPKGNTTESRGEASKKPQKQQYEFDINTLNDPSTPLGLLKYTMKNRYHGTFYHKFLGDQDHSNPFIGVATTDKIFNNDTIRFNTDVPEHLANAYQQFLTGQHLGTKHYFAKTKEEWAKYCTHTDPNRVAGFNRGGFEVFYNNIQADKLLEYLNTKKLTGNEAYDAKILNTVNTMLHEQIHSVYYNMSEKSEYRQQEPGAFLTLEEGLTQYLSLNMTESFLTFGGFLDDPAEKAKFDKARKEFMAQTSYNRETGHIGLMSYMIGQKLGVSEKDTVTMLFNMKNNATLSAGDISKALSSLLGTDSYDTMDALYDYLDSGNKSGMYSCDKDAILYLAKTLGCDQQTINNITLALSNAGGDPYLAYRLLKDKLWK